MYKHEVFVKQTLCVLLETIRSKVFVLQQKLLKP